MNDSEKEEVEASAESTYVPFVIAHYGSVGSHYGARSIKQSYFQAADPSDKRAKKKQYRPMYYANATKRRKKDVE